MRKAVIVLALVWTTAALAATDMEKFGRYLKRFTSDPSASKPKGGCICTEVGPNQGRTGRLVQFGVASVSPAEAWFQILCDVQIFDPATGALQATALCGDFIPLVK